MDGGTKGERATETFLKEGGNWWRVSVAQLEVSFFLQNGKKTSWVVGKEGRRGKRPFLQLRQHTRKKGGRKEKKGGSPGLA